LRIAITGSTGVIGYALAKSLNEQHDVAIVARGTLPPPDIDVLICAHGTYGRTWQEAIVVNLIYTMNCVYSVLGGDVKHIVLLGGAGIGGDNIDENAAYAASKGGLVAFAESIAKSHPKVSINVVAPGPVRSKMNPKATTGPEKCVEMVQELIALDHGQFSGNLVSAVHDAKLFERMPGIYKLRRVAP